jgi:hypothetical protein
MNNDPFGKPPRYIGAVASMNTGGEPALREPLAEGILTSLALRAHGIDTAGSAGEPRVDDDAIPWLCSVDGRPYLFDDAGRLMTKHLRERYDCR